MKGDFLKILTLLIAFFYMNILEINNIRKANLNKLKNINNDEDYVRYLKDEDYTTGRTDPDDRESIENCQDSDEDYFSYLVSNKNFKFTKYVDERDSVIKNYIIFKLIGTTY